MADHLSAAFATEHAAWDPAEYQWDASFLTAQPDPARSAGGMPVLDGVLPMAFGGDHQKQCKLHKGPIICQVEGCSRDLALEKGYYQRYRVCEQHLKLLSLMVDGRPSRFCQQCGRFHDLSEFDGNKRSCRARLQQHNARRRKRDPSHDTTTKSSAPSRARVQNNTDSSPEMSTQDQDVMSVNTDRMVAAELDAGLDQAQDGLRVGQSVTSCTAPGPSGFLSAPGSMHLPTTQQSPLQMGLFTGLSDQATCRSSFGVPNLGVWPNAPGIDGTSSSQLQPTAGGDPFARSSLASVQSHPGPSLLRSTGGSMQLDDMLLEDLLASAVEDSDFQVAPVNLASVHSTGSSSMTGLLRSGDHMLSSNSLGTGLTAMPGLSLPLPAPAPAIAGHMSFTDLGSALNKKAQTYQPARLSSALGLPGDLGPNHVSFQGGPFAPPRPSGLSSFDLARQLVAGGGSNAQYQADNMLVRISIKIANCTPDQLPPDLYLRLQNLLSAADASLLQSFLRPGCTHLILDICQQARSTPVQLLSSSQLSAAFGSAFLHKHTVLVQQAGKVALHQPLQRPCLGSITALGVGMPELLHLQPAAVVAESGSLKLIVYGKHLLAAGVRFFARCQGGYLPVRCAQAVQGDARIRRHLEAQAAGCVEAVELQLDAQVPFGLVVVEAQAAGGCGILSNWKPCVLLPNDSSGEQQCAELCGLVGHFLSGRFDRRSIECAVLAYGMLLDGEAKSDANWREEQLLRDMGVMSGPLQEATGCRSSTLLAAENLIGWACKLGLPALATTLVSLLLAEGQNLASVLGAPYPDGATLLHKVAASGSVGLLQAAWHWTQLKGQQRLWSSCQGSLGLSPLHLVACQPALAAALLPGLDEPTRAAWTSAAARDGKTPSDLYVVTLKLHSKEHQRPAAAQLSPPVLASAPSTCTATAAASCPPTVSQSVAGGAGSGAGKAQCRSPWAVLAWLWMLMPGLLLTVSCSARSGLTAMARLAVPLCSSVVVSLFITALNFTHC